MLVLVYARVYVLASIYVSVYQNETIYFDVEKVGFFWFEMKNVKQNDVENCFWNETKGFFLLQW